MSFDNIDLNSIVIALASVISNNGLDSPEAQNLIGSMLDEIMPGAIASIGPSTVGNLTNITLGGSLAPRNRSFAQANTGPLVCIIVVTILIVLVFVPLGIFCVLRDRMLQEERQKTLEEEEGSDMYSADGQDREMATNRSGSIPVNRTRSQGSVSRSNSNANSSSMSVRSWRSNQQ